MLCYKVLIFRGREASEAVILGCKQCDFGIGEIKAEETRSIQNLQSLRERATLHFFLLRLAADLLANHAACSACTDGSSLCWRELAAFRLPAETWLVIHADAEATDTVILTSATRKLNMNTRAYRW